MDARAKLLTVLVIFLCACHAHGQISKVWVADNGDGTYKNPIIHADYSDPDVIRVGEDFYMTASSFNAVPGLPILHSRDLVNWKLVNHALPALEPADLFARPQHGGGVWAPAMRYHAGEFYIYYGDPDFGIYMTKTKDPAGKWSKPLLVKEAKGWIDPCPLWDTDGNAYLVHAFAGSRAGIKSILVVNRMSSDGTRLLDNGVIVYDGHASDPTVEGPKFYKFKGYYYILAPAGGVATGWQLALRSKGIYGPYERKVVLAQGGTAINGPHQGALVDTPSGEWWFFHFQDKGPYGRVVHLQPSVWKNGFPVIGSDPDGDGTGEPVAVHKKPRIAGRKIIATPADDDEFSSPTLGLQWQWHANPLPGWAFPDSANGVLRLNSVRLPDGYRNLWDAPNLLLQKFPANRFTAEAKIKIEPRTDGEKLGMVIMGADYSYVGITRHNGQLYISQFSVTDADKGTPEVESDPVELSTNTLYLSALCTDGAVCSFQYSLDGTTRRAIGTPFRTREGRWIGSKIGFFFSRSTNTNDGGTVDIDWIRFRPDISRSR